MEAQEGLTRGPLQKPVFADSRPKLRVLPIFGVFKYLIWLLAAGPDYLKTAVVKTYTVFGDGVS
jgi:hypothetical protein